MTAKNVAYIMWGLILLILGVGVGSLVVGNKMLGAQAAKLHDLKVQNRVLDTQQAALQTAKKNVVKYTPLNTEAQVIVPQDKDQAQSVREIVAFADQAGVKIGGIIFPASNLGISKGTSTTSPSQVQPVTGMKGIYQLPITVQSDSGNPIVFNQLVTFLRLLENNRHTAQVSQLTITPADTTNQHLSFQIIVDVYIKP